MKKNRGRKNFFPTLIAIVVLWLIIFSLIYFVDPKTVGVIPIFFGLFFTALLFTFSTLLINTRRGLITASTLTVFIILRYFGLGHVLNLFLLSGVAISLEVYFSKGHRA